MAIGPTEPSTTVYPSGGDLATSSTPIMPPAPPRLSTTTCCPSCEDSLGAMMREVISVPPPGANGLTHLIACCGHACAQAEPVSAMAANPQSHRVVFSTAFPRCLVQLSASSVIARMLREPDALEQT